MYLVCINIRLGWKTLKSYLSVKRTTRSFWSPKVSNASFNRRTFWPPPIEFVTSPPFQSCPVPRTYRNIRKHLYKLIFFPIIKYKILSAFKGHASIKTTFKLLYLRHSNKKIKFNANGKKKFFKQMLADKQDSKCTIHR